MTRRDYRVPGRVEFLGKHTDYVGGRSLVCATEQGISATATEHEAALLRIDDSANGLRAELPLRSDLAIPRGEWVAYPATVARRLARDFGPLGRGIELRFASDLPQDAGLSSSSALVVLVALAIADANRLAEHPAWRSAIPDREALANYLGAVENGRAFGPFAADGGVGTQGGSQDHTAILCSRPGMLAQYRWVPVRFERVVPFPAGYVLVVAVSGVEAAKGAGALEHYNRLSGDASELLRIWRERARRDDPTLLSAMASTPDAFERLVDWLEGHPRRDTLRARAVQFRDECFELIPGAGDALERGDLEALGSLVDRSQHGAETGLGNQIPETMHLQRTARRLGAVAASAFGAGFGGSVWAMVRSDQAPFFTDRWACQYREAFPRHAATVRFAETPAGAPVQSSSLEAL